MHIELITRAAPEALTPLLIVGALSVVAFAAFLLYLRTRRSGGLLHGKGNRGRPATRARKRLKLKKR